MKDWIAAGLVAAMLGIAIGPLLVGRHLLRRRRAAPLTATGVFYLPDEPVRVDAAGEPLTETDLSARTASTSLTVDPQHLAEILQLEETAEWAITPATWTEIGAAEAFMRDPLTSAVLPPVPLMEEAGNPALAQTFYAALADGGITYDWSAEDGAFHFWDSDIELAGHVDEPSREMPMVKVGASR